MEKSLWGCMSSLGRSGLSGLPASSTEYLSWVTTNGTSLPSQECFVHWYQHWWYGERDEQDVTSSSMDISGVPTSSHQLSPEHGPVASLSPEGSPSHGSVPHAIALQLKTTPSLSTTSPVCCFPLLFIFFFFFCRVNVPLLFLSWMVPCVLKFNCLYFQLRKTVMFWYFLLKNVTYFEVKCDFFFFCFVLDQDMFVVSIKILDFISETTPTAAKNMFGLNLYWKFQNHTIYRKTVIPVSFVC